MSSFQRRLALSMTLAALAAAPAAAHAQARGTFLSVALQPGPPAGPEELSRYKLLGTELLGTSSSATKPGTPIGIDFVMLGGSTVVSTALGSAYAGHATVPWVGVTVATPGKVTKYAFHDCKVGALEKTAAGLSGQLRCTTIQEWAPSAATPSGQTGWDLKTAKTG